MSTSGVLPIRSRHRRVAAVIAQPPATAGRIDTSAPSATGVSRPCEVAHVVVVDVDVHELVQRPVVGQHLAGHARVLGHQLGEDLADGGPVDADGGRTAGVAAQDGW